VEIVMLRLVSWPHYLYGAIALFLVVDGLVLVRAPLKDGD